MDINKAIKRREERKEYQQEYSKKKKQKLISEHRCIWCKKKIKPVIIYPQLCEKHNQKNRNKSEEDSNKKVKGGNK